MTRRYVSLIGSCTVLFLIGALVLWSGSAFSRSGDSEIGDSPLFGHISDLSASGMEQKVWNVGDATVQRKAGQSPQVQNYAGVIDAGQQVPSNTSPGTGFGHYQLDAANVL